MIAPCSLCSSRDFRTIHRNVPRHGTGEPTRFDVVHCASCGLKQTRPLPSQHDLHVAYGETFTWRAEPGVVSRVEGLYRQLMVRADQLRALRQAARLGQGLRVLDIGCGDGLLLAEARKAGLDALGVDRAGAPLWRDCDPGWREDANIETLDRAGEDWDVVSLFHVAEHLLDPVGLFRRVSDWLAPRGILVLQVPNAGSAQARLLGAKWFGYDVPRHVVHWELPTLARALFTAGFAIANVRYMSWRDDGQLWINSLFPGLDPLVERERMLSERSRAEVMLRRLLYVALIWSATPVTMLEAALHTSGTMTVFAQKGRQLIGER